MEREALLARLAKLRSEGTVWVCSGARPHGFGNLPHNGDSGCPECHAKSFIEINHAVDLATRDLPINLYAGAA